MGILELMFYSIRNNAPMNLLAYNLNMCFPVEIS